MKGGNPQRRRIRLKPATYTQIGVICSITIAVRGRRPVFVSPAIRMPPSTSSDVTPG